MFISVDNGIITLTDMGDSYAPLADTGLFRYNRAKYALEGRVSLDALNAIGRVNGGLPQWLLAMRNDLITVNDRVAGALNEDDPQLRADCNVDATLLKHQVRGVNAALEHFRYGQTSDRGFAYLFDMGTGKTLTTLALIGALYNLGAVRRVLIVCPTSIIGSWVQEIGKFARYTHTVKQLIGDKAKRIKALEGLQVVGRELGGVQFAIINYESTHRDGIEPALAGFRADMIVCDESQRIKNPQAAQAKAMHRLGKRAKYRVILSGTPIQNAAIDIFSQYKFLDDSVFGSSFYSFRNRYAIMGGYGNHQIIGYKNMQDLSKKMYNCAYRVMLAECVDLPEQIFIDRTLTFAPKEQAIYDRLKRDGIAEIERAEGDNVKVLTPTVLTQITRLRQLTGGFAVDADTDNAEPKRVNTVKVEALSDIIDDYVVETGQKLVVFATYLAEIFEIEKLLKKRKIKYGLIYGDVPIADRGDIVNDFQTNPETKVFVAQTATAGLGITLTAASVTVFYSMSYNAADYNQALARTHRIGQTQKTTYIHLLVKKSIDEKIKKMVDNKITFADGILNGGWRNLFE